MEIEISLLTKNSKEKYSQVLKSIRDKLNNFSKKYNELASSRKFNEKGENNSKVKLNQFIIEYIIIKHLFNRTRQIPN